MLLKDQEKPYYLHRQIMVGGSQTNPVLEWVKEEVHLSPKELGEVFRVDFGGYHIPRWFVVVDESSAEILPLIISDKLEHLFRSIERDKWIGDDFVLAKRDELNGLKAAVSLTVLSAKSRLQKSRKQ
jgi:hypothetical protein